MASITSANAIYMISIAGLFPIPQKLQGFATDDIYGTEPIDAAETQMGVDGHLSAGFVYASIRQTIMLQADSASNILFDQWYSQQIAQEDTFEAQATVLLPSLSRKFTHSRGFLRTYQPIPDAKKVLQPRRHVIEWQRITPSVG